MPYSGATALQEESDRWVVSFRRSSGVMRRARTGPEVGDGPDKVGGSDGAADRGLLVLVVDALASEVGGSALRDLEDDGRLGVAGSLEDGVDLRARHGGMTSSSGRNGQRTREIALRT
jgi:hypothetical protein